MLKWNIQQIREACYKSPYTLRKSIEGFIIAKRLTLTIVLSALVGLLAFFLTENPFRKEIGFAVTVLVFLLSVQVYFIAKRSRARPRNILRTPQPTAKPANAIQKSGPEVEEKLKNQISPEVFSRFQESIDQSEKEREKDAQEDANVVLSISSKGKEATTGSAAAPKLHKIPIKTKPPISSIPESGNKAETEKKPATPPPVGNESENREEVPTEPIGSLFDDVQEPLAISENRKPKDPRKTIKEIEKEKSVEEVDTSEPIMAHEVLTSDDLLPNRADIKDEAELILSVAQKAYQVQNFDEGISTINQFLNGSLTKLSNLKDIQDLILLKGECEFELKQFDSASKTWFEIFQKYLNKEDPEFLSKLEELIDKFRKAEQLQYAVHFLFTTLNEYRQKQDLEKMDETYHEIEAAYNQQQDWKRLIQTYQNHLTIKRTLKDLKGQVDILDHLGKILYDQNDAEGSRKCYEQRLAIETQLKKN